MNLRHYGLASALVLALAASAGCGGGTEAADENGVPKGSRRQREREFR